MEKPRHIPHENILKAGQVYLTALNDSHEAAGEFVDLGSQDVILAIGWACMMAGYAAVCTVTGSTQGGVQ